MSNLTDQLGGPAGIRIAVEDLYRRLCADPLLAPYFVDVDMQRLRAHMIDFLGAALGADHARYHGRDMSAAHAHLHITDGAFDSVAGHLIDTLASLGVDRPVIDTVIGQIAPLREQIVRRRPAAAAV